MSFAIRSLTLFLIISSHLVIATSQDFFTKSYYVYIVNGLPDNTFLLKFRCQSKDDDLGTHFLRVGEDFHWKFSVNFRLSTLFFCHFYWHSKDRSFVVFDVPNRAPKCELGKANVNGSCYWLVRTDGFYFCNYRADPNSRDWVKVHYW
ncbi:hypothetical protein LguiA_030417 [Lonicera macranthoides]